MTAFNQQRFDDYLSGQMSDEETAAFEAALADDPALEAAFDAYSSEALNLGGLDLGELDLPPVDLTEGVKSRIRRRSRGRYFGRHREQRQHIHLFLLCAIGLLIGASLIATPNVLAALFGDAEFVRLDDPASDAPDDPPDAAEPHDEAVPSELPAPIEAPETVPPTDPTEPTPATTNQDAQGVSPFPVREMQHREEQFTIASTLPSERLGARLREQFGRDRVRTDDDGVIRVSVRRGDVQQTVTRISDLGVLHRDLIDADPASPTVDILFRPAR